MPEIKRERGITLDEFVENTGSSFLNLLEKTKQRDILKLHTNLYANIKI